MGSSGNGGGRAGPGSPGGAGVKCSPAGPVAGRDGGCWRGRESRDAAHARDVTVTDERGARYTGRKRSAVSSGSPRKHHRALPARRRAAAGRGRSLLALEDPRGGRERVSAGRAAPGTGRAAPLPGTGPRSAVPGPPRGGRRRACPGPAGQLLWRPGGGGGMGGPRPLRPPAASRRGCHRAGVSVLRAGDRRRPGLSSRRRYRQPRGVAMRGCPGPSTGSLRGSGGGGGTGTE